MPMTAKESGCGDRTGDLVMHVEFDDGDWRRFKIQKEPYGSVVIVNFSSPFDSFGVVDDRELVVYKSGSVIARFDVDGRQTY